MLHFDGRRKLDMTVQLTYPFSNGGEARVARLKIEDQASSMVVFEMEIPADQLLVMMSGGQARLEARAPKADYMHRIGKKMEHGSDTWQRWGDAGVPEADMPARVEAWREANGWEAASYNSGQGGVWRVHGRRWVEITEEESA